MAWRTRDGLPIVGAQGIVTGEDCECCDDPSSTCDPLEKLIGEALVTNPPAYVRVEVSGSTAVEGCTFSGLVGVGTAGMTATSVETIQATIDGTYCLRPRDLTTGLILDPPPGPTVFERRYWHWFVLPEDGIYVKRWHGTHECVQTLYGQPDNLDNGAPDFPWRHDCFNGLVVQVTVTPAGLGIWLMVGAIANTSEPQRGSGGLGICHAFVPCADISGPVIISGDDWTNLAPGDSEPVRMWFYENVSVTLTADDGCSSVTPAKDQTVEPCGCPTYPACLLGEEPDYSPPTPYPPPGGTPTPRPPKLPPPVPPGGNPDPDPDPDPPGECDLTTPNPLSYLLKRCNPPGDSSGGPASGDLQPDLRMPPGTQGTYLRIAEECYVVSSCRSMLAPNVTPDDTYADCLA
ncbi:MAG TPA: hypothetical protein VF624_15115, partial [Tepidisphaeraceae bacterium]